MDASVKWINDYVKPPADADEQAELLTRAGFPLEGRETVEQDICQDFEMTSNRGDCVCHIGLAREVAAISGRTLTLPAPKNEATGPDAAQKVTVTNECPDRCPLYTARLITGITVGPSPEWIAERLRAIGQIPRNNVVDATNFVLFEYGQPTHVFDLDTLHGPEIIIRMARDGEAFLPIGEGEAEVKLTTDDCVIADADRAIAIGGVKGGALTAVTETTTNILIEAATFSPVTVRRSSRRHNIASDSSYRYERGVHPAHIEPAAQRLVELILETAGGTLHEGVVLAGAPMPEPRHVSMRPDRCRKLLGVEITNDQMIEWLRTLEFQPEMADGQLRCTVPVHRLDIEREIDVIEEVGRMFGHDHIPIKEAIEIQVAPPQPRQMAHRAVVRALVGMDYVETTTHSLVSEAAGAPFLEPGHTGLLVDDDRAKGEPMLRPSVVPSLLRVRQHNRNNGVEHLKLFELASTFSQGPDAHTERVCLTLLADMDDPDAGLRPVRGAIERLARLLLGPDATVDVIPDDSTSWLTPGGRVHINGRDMGRFGVVASALRNAYDLEQDVVAAELDLPTLFDVYPPDTEARALPTFPSIERDLSVILTDDVTWGRVHEVITGVQTDHLEAVEFVTTFRGKQIGAGRRSLTARLRFRAPDRTLVNDEIDPQADAVVAALTEQLGATLRA